MHAGRQACSIYVFPVWRTVLLSVSLTSNTGCPEHLDYEDFSTALSEIRRVCGRTAIVSLPDANRAARLLVSVPYARELRCMFSAPMKKSPPMTSAHYWEIGRKGYPLKRIVSNVLRVGFKLSRTYRVFEYPYHRFFILDKVRSIEAVQPDKDG